MPGLRTLEVPRSRATLFALALSAAVALTLVFTTVDPWLEKAGILAGGLDVHIYREGAWRLLHGHSLYTDETVGGLLYTYTPFSAIVFMPGLAVSAAWITDAFLLVNLGVLYACVLMSFRMLGYRLTGRLASVAALLALTCVFLEPVRTTLFYGQINLVLMLLVLWDFSRPEGARLRGLGVGVAAGIKLVPAFFLTQYLALRQWRSAATATAVLAATVALAWLVSPSDSRQYWFSTFFHSDRIAPDTEPANQSIRGVLAHLSDGASPIWLWLLLAGMVAGAGVGIAVALYRRGEHLLSVTLTGMTACAVSPFSWGHHWVWFVPLLVHLVHRAQTRPAWWIAATLLVIATGAWTYQWTPDFASVGVFVLPKPWHTEPILENAHVLVFFLALGYGLRVAWSANRALDHTAATARVLDGSCT
ncbi:glycosyltransferase 87 family protein [Nocardia sp. CDC160]|uniref:glycosyltransferase 87 family protein n=1 Tax=Nocardia sp. CDC160 TaxID=3112166 RepID=UPI002DB5B800|nr:glycosyltransferase 87 family protein [Nocardia sp. CDC160]MEC3916217.1 glycosyltransferase 87 family protein [Nocardia sp. CDC160]